MTAEIGILNKEAVAADSAVTVSDIGGQKIFSSANKLFALSKYHPVGVMVFGRASFMGVPWETLIKLYRSRLGKKSFPTLQQYAQDLISFLETERSLSPEAEQRRYVHHTLVSYLRLVQQDFMKAAEAALKQRRRLSAVQFGRIAGKVVREHSARVRARPRLPGLPRQHARAVGERYSEAIRQAIQDVFEKLPITTPSMNRLRRLGGEIFCRDLFPSSTAGLVIAGFGSSDLFPSLVSFQLEAVVADKLKYRAEITQTIDPETNSAAVLTFAQSEMVSTFMEGIDPELAQCMNAYLNKVFVNYPGVIVDSIGGLDDAAKGELTRKLAAATQTLFTDYSKRMQTYRRERHVDPIVRVVAHLPKDELGAMAESLVSLTSFKRRITMEAETVGGPIDVALISKGDGFIWIKRKHYFKAELNAQFFANYYRETADGQ